jgi:hypothetical protein
MPPQQQRLPLPTRPVSQDGKARSPSRLSTHSSSSRSRPMTTKEIAAEKVKQDRMLAKSATKGILGASGIAMFLDALEGLWFDFDFFWDFFTKHIFFLLQFCILPGVTFTLVFLIIAKYSWVWLWDTGHVSTSDDMDVEKRMS